jgi:excisionase family DNA binding protein
MKKTPPKPYLTMEETAATLRVSERTVRRWIARGALTVRKVGGTVRVPREALLGGGSTVLRPKRGRPRKVTAGGVSALSDDIFMQTWDNPEDAIYDRWREIYGIRKR